MVVKYWIGNLRKIRKIGNFIIENVRNWVSNVRLWKRGSNNIYRNISNYRI